MRYRAVRVVDAMKGVVVTLTYEGRDGAGYAVTFTGVTSWVERLFVVERLTKSVGGKQDCRLIGAGHVLEIHAEDRCVVQVKPPRLIPHTGGWCGVLA